MPGTGEDHARYHLLRINAWADLGATKCSTHQESMIARTRCARSAGWLVAATLAGFVVRQKEFVGAKSLGQRYIFSGELFEAVAESGTIIQADACSEEAAAVDAKRAIFQGLPEPH